ncbi:MAG: phage portal protein [Chloroflexi bacterium]|nr:phage portal protein [Chloroflexota bacterium]
MDNLTLPQQIERMDLDRLRTYSENLDFYNGAQWPGRPRRGERRLIFNYSRAFIDKVTSYLMVDTGFSIEPWDGSPEASERAKEVENTLLEVYEANNLQQLDFDTELDTSILGDGAYKVTWDAEEQRVRVSAPDVQGIYVWWVGDDVTQVRRVASRYKLSAEEVELLYGIKAPGPGLNGRRSESTVVEVWTTGSLEIWIDNALHQQRPNPYGFIPFLIFPNIREPKRFWGISDIPAIIEPARELNRAFSQLSMILELSGNPIAVLENVEDAQDIAVQPGAVWELPDKARAYLLDLLQGGGVKLHTDFINLVYRALHDLSESPRTSFGDNRQGLSGVALEMELNPLIQKIRRKRLIRTAVYRHRIQMILKILERKQGRTLGPVRTRIVWGPILPQDRSRLIQDEEVLVRTGIHSRRRAMENLGIPDPDGELARLKQEAINGTEPRSPSPV